MVLLLRMMSVSTKYHVNVQHWAKLYLCTTADSKGLITWMKVMHKKVTY